MLDSIFIITAILLQTRQYCTAIQEMICALGPMNSQDARGIGKRMQTKRTTSVSIAVVVNILNLTLKI